MSDEDCMVSCTYGTCRSQPPCGGCCACLGGCIAYAQEVEVDAARIEYESSEV